MIINLSPQVSGKTLSLSVNSDVLTVNNTDYDFSVIPEGATLPADAVESDFIIGNIDRVDGTIHLTVLLPIQADASESARFPEPINQTSGPVELPS